MYILNVALLVFLISSINLNANDTTILDSMKKMRDGMVEIQDGFFYNQPSRIQSGIKAVEDANSIFTNSRDIEKYLPSNKQHMVGITFSNSKKITSKLKEMKNAIQKSQFNKASDMYANIVKDCTSCHSTIRGW